MTIEWIRRGCLDIAEFPDGVTAIVRDTHDGTPRPVLAETFVSSGKQCLCAWTIDVEAAKKKIELEHAPKPLASGPDWSFWVSEDKTRSAHVSGRGASWWIDRNVAPIQRFLTRESAEAAAAKYVRGE